MKLIRVPKTDDESSGCSSTTAHNSSLSVKAFVPLNCYLLILLTRAAKQSNFTSPNEKKNLKTPFLIHGAYPVLNILFSYFPSS